MTKYITAKSSTTIDAYAADEEKGSTASSKKGTSFYFLESDNNAFLKSSFDFQNNFSFTHRFPIASYILEM